MSQCQKLRRRAGSDSTALEAVMPDARFQAKKPSSMALPLRVSGWPPGSNGPRVTSALRVTWPADGLRAPCIHEDASLSACRSAG